MGLEAPQAPLTAWELGGGVQLGPENKSLQVWGGGLAAVLTLSLPKMELLWGQD